MTPITKITSTLLVCLLSGTAAFAAPDPAAVADRLFAEIEEDSKITYENAAYDSGNDEIMISNVTVINEGERVNIATVSIAGYDESNTSGLTADKVTIAGISSELNEGEFSVSSVGISDINIPDFDLNPEDPKSWRGIVSSFAVQDVLVAPPNKSAISIASIKGTSTVTSPDSISGTTTLAIDDLRVPGSVMEDEAKMFFDAAGYELLLIDLDVDFSYDAASQNLSLSNFSLDADKMGSLTFSASLGGIVEAMLSDPSQIQGLIATATVKNASLNFTNNSIFDKGLEFGAMMMGQDVEQLKSQAPLMLGFGLAQINNPAFTTMVTDAVNAFLADPKSLQIDVAPANPVPVAQVAGAAATAPQTVPDMLAVSVIANK